MVLLDGYSCRPHRRRDRHRLSMLAIKKYGHRRRKASSPPVAMVHAPYQLFLQVGLCRVTPDEVFYQHWPLDQPVCADLADYCTSLQSFIVRESYSSGTRQCSLLPSLETSSILESILCTASVRPSLPPAVELSCSLRVLSVCQLAPRDAQCSRGRNTR